MWRCLDGARHMAGTQSVQVQPGIFWPLPASQPHHTREHPSPPLPCLSFCYLTHQASSAPGALHVLPLLAQCSSSGSTWPQHKCPTSEGHSHSSPPSILTSLLHHNTSVPFVTLGTKCHYLFLGYHQPISSMGTISTSALVPALFPR